ncbi:hypothetical protein PPERSA_03332 [Pseudocohnilembus persalinus]|uniref:Uncharacterized protein n=1 Tax=Pseudocohnilembus persalinus TaxID=266149 RepID=A0A0V0Q8K4_PSEPJ|nr:hypothetical protein PPERSA_03332 [Pseudocohnilembus persalinus]|eukprot:KRW98501.1 hypothetical protein PPERSA_03332 [Pseudocohnilembus persalinus]
MAEKNQCQTNFQMQNLKGNQKELIELENDNQKEGSDLEEVDILQDEDGNPLVDENEQYIKVTDGLDLEQYEFLENENGDYIKSSQGFYILKLKNQNQQLQIENENYIYNNSYGDSQKDDQNVNDQQCKQSEDNISIQSLPSLNDSHQKTQYYQQSQLNKTQSNSIFDRIKLNSRNHHQQQQEQRNYDKRTTSNSQQSKKYSQYSSKSSSTSRNYEKSFKNSPKANRNMNWNLVKRIRDGGIQAQNCKKKKKIRNKRRNSMYQSNSRSNSEFQQRNKKKSRLSRSPDNKKQEMKKKKSYRKKSRSSSYSSRSSSDSRFRRNNPINRYKGNKRYSERWGQRKFSQDYKYYAENINQNQNQDQHDIYNQYRQKASQNYHKHFQEKDKQRERKFNDDPIIQINYNKGDKKEEFKIEKPNLQPIDFTKQNQDITYFVIMGKKEDIQGFQNINMNQFNQQININQQQILSIQQANTVNQIFKTQDQQKQKQQSTSNNKSRSRSQSKNIKKNQEISQIINKPQEVQQNQVDENKNKIIQKDKISMQDLVKFNKKTVSELTNENKQKQKLEKQKYVDLERIITEEALGVNQNRKKNLQEQNDVKNLINTDQNEFAQQTNEVMHIEKRPYLPPDLQQRKEQKIQQDIVIQQQQQQKQQLEEEKEQQRIIDERIKNEETLKKQSTFQNNFINNNQDNQVINQNNNIQQDNNDNFNKNNQQQQQIADKNYNYDSDSESEKKSDKSSFDEKIDEYDQMLDNIF